MTEFRFQVEEGIPYEPKKYRKATQKRTFDIEQIKVGVSILAQSRAERSLITSSLNYYQKRYPDIYGHLMLRSIPEIDGETKKVRYRVFFLERPKAE